MCEGSILILKLWFASLFVAGAWFAVLSHRRPDHLDARRYDHGAVRYSQAISLFGPRHSAFRDALKRDAPRLLLVGRIFELLFFGFFLLLLASPLFC